MKAIKRRALGLLGLFFLSLASASLGAQDISNTSIPLDESLLFGGEADIVKVIDTDVAARGIVELVADTKTYPVFLVEGGASAGFVGDYTPFGASTTDSQTLFGAVNLDGLSFTFLPMKDVRFGLETDVTLTPQGLQNFTVDAYADIRISEFSRLYASGSFADNLTTNESSLVEATEGFSLDEFFLDAAIDRKLFFRLGKQNVSWGVGTWYKPADVLSLAAIDPDDPNASREGPFAFKADMPFGLNHATLYIVPPLEGDFGQFSVAQRTDLVVGGFELSVAGFYRSDLVAKPKLMMMFSGALGDFDLYGENVLAWGSDRIYAREISAGIYDTYRIENTPVFQSTVGAKFSWENSDGLGIDLHVQGYYNGAGYWDLGTLDSGAKNAIKKVDNYSSSDISRSGAGMYYLAANVSFSSQFGEGKKLTKASLGSSALFGFSDMSMRFKPAFDLSIGSAGNALEMTISALTALGDVGSEYAPRGSMVSPSISMNILQDVSVSISTPIVFNTDYSVKKTNIDVSIMWNVLEFDS